MPSVLEAGDTQAETFQNNAVHNVVSRGRIYALFSSTLPIPKWPLVLCQKGRGIIYQYILEVQCTKIGALGGGRCPSAWPGPLTVQEP